MEPEENSLLGYSLQEQVAKGAFGKVFRALDADGQQVAIKVLLEDIRGDVDLLRAFRRGVRSMRILAEHEVEGMVAYSEASEIPAFVAMEWIEGPNLSEAKQARQIENWPTILRIASQLVDIIQRAHALPERVLHRDIRPSNVMLKDYYTAPEDWSVAVLDFDLSWHRGAPEKSVLHTAIVGYLAPEQIRPTQDVSTRSAAVDSFGIGMTLYFLCSGCDPLPDEHRHSDWESEVNQATSRIPAAGWLSIAARFTRLILCSTRDRQTQRWDLSEIAGELAVLQAAVAQPEAVASAELLAEEVAARSEMMKGYRWDIDHGRAIREFPTGLSLSLRGDEPNETIDLIIQWTSIGVENRRRVGKYLGPAARNASARLERNGWNIIDLSIGKQDIRMRAKLGLRQAVADISRVAAAIDTATTAMRVE